MEKYKKMTYVGILSFSHPISNDLRDKVTKFSGNDAITGEDRLRKFTHMLNDYEEEHEDVVMKLLVHSLTKDARDWLKIFPDDSIGSSDFL